MGSVHEDAHELDHKLTAARNNNRNNQGVMMKRTAPFPRSLPFAPRRLAFLVALALAGGAYTEFDPAAAPATAVELRGLPITFERNDGQYPAEVLFVSRGLRGALALKSTEIAISPRHDGLGGGEPMRLRLRGANLAPEVEPARPLATRSHHYRGGDRFENVPHFGELQVRDVYPGIDMVLHGRDGSLEYDFVVAPGADPKNIRIDLGNAERVALDAQGNLNLARGNERLVQHAPVAYQGEGAQRRSVEASFELVEGAEGPEARIVLGDYDPGISLTVDPTIKYSSYVGSSGGDGGTILRVDPSGDVYFTQLGASGSVDAVVVNKLDPNSNTLVYTTSFGGHGFSTGNDLALGGAAGTTLYVAGTTRAIDFPALPAKTNFSNDAFVAVLAPSGALVQTRLIGGSGSDLGNAIAVDTAGNVYLAGTTNSRDLGVTVGPPLNGNFFSADSDGFVAKLDPALSTVYLRYVGGSGFGGDSIAGVAVDDVGQAIVVGTTFSTNFPQVNVGSPASPPPSGTGQPRGFASKLTSTGASYVYSQFVGGTSFSADAVAFDPTTGDAVVGGVIANSGLVPASARPFGGSFDAFVLRLGSAGAPTFATYLGGTSNDLLEAVMVDDGAIYVTGVTRSADYPVVDPQPGGGARNGTSDAFVTRLVGGTVDFSAYLGGSSEDTGTSLAIDPQKGVWVGGFTHSVDFPVQHPFRASRFGPSDGFITQITGLAKLPKPPKPPK
jgi:hypothetical protein